MPGFADRRQAVGRRRPFAFSEIGTKKTSRLIGSRIFSIVDVVLSLSAPKIKVAFFQAISLPPIDEKLPGGVGVVAAVKDNSLIDDLKTAGPVNFPQAPFMATWEPSPGACNAAMASAAFAL